MQTDVNDVIDGFYLRKVAMLEDENAAFRADMVDSQHWKEEYVESLRRVAELENALRAVEWSDGIYGYGYCRLCGDPWIEDANAEHKDFCIIGNALRQPAPDVAAE